MTEDIIGEGLWGAGLTPDELAQMQSKTGWFANRVYVRPYGAMVRISFGELIEGKTNWHTSIVVTAEELITFSELFLTQAAWALSEAAKQSGPATQKQPAQEQGDASQE